MKKKEIFKYGYSMVKHLEIGFRVLITGPNLMDSPRIVGIIDREQDGIQLNNIFSYGFRVKTMKPLN